MSTHKTPSPTSPSHAHKSGRRALAAAGGGGGASKTAGVKSNGRGFSPEEVAALVATSTINGERYVECQWFAFVTFFSA